MSKTCVLNIMEGTVSTNLYHVHKIFCAQLYLKFARIVMGQISLNFSEFGVFPL